MSVPKVGSYHRPVIADGETMPRSSVFDPEFELDRALAALPFDELVHRRLEPVVRQLSGATDLYRTVVAQVERPLIVLALQRTGGNQIQAAQLLGINRNTLHKKCVEHGIDPAAPAWERPSRLGHTVDGPHAEA